MVDQMVQLSNSNRSGYSSSGLEDSLKSIGEGNPFRFIDDLGPAKVLHLYDPLTGLKAILVVDNVAIGPAIGGVRMAEDVTTEEVFRLARAMTLKMPPQAFPMVVANLQFWRTPRYRCLRKNV